VLSEHHKRLLLDIYRTFRSESMPNQAKG
jgi:hypothetical protein